MPEETEVETSDLQEAIDEMHRERGEREKEQKESAWTKYVGLTTAILAVFAAVGALESGSLVNEAMIQQLKASDSWNEYQASREKNHLYTLAANSLIDAGVLNGNTTVSGTPKNKDKWAPKNVSDRIKEYEGQVKKEDDKAKDLTKKSQDLEKDSSGLMEKHHSFAASVALIQVAIALGAISALAKIKTVWLLSLLVGIGGIAAFVVGFLLRG